MRVVPRGVLIGAVLATAATAAVVAVHQAYVPLRDRVRALDGYRPPAAIRVVDRHGHPLDEIGPRHRWVDVDDLPAPVLDAFVAAEDRRFWTHRGVDPRGILRAAWVDWRAGALEEGGSTITQQVVKLLVVGDEPTLSRKLREVVAAWTLERELSKEHILELYLNVVYLGSGAYGVEAAAEEYFGVPASELATDQAALLACLVPAPSLRSPGRDPEAAVRRRNLVLGAMAAEGTLTEAELAALSERPLGLVARAGPVSRAEAYRTEVRRLLEQVLGEDPPYELGLVVHTGADAAVQALAERAVQQAVDRVDARRRRRERTPPRAPGERPGIEGAAVVLENATGEVVALVGAYRDHLGGLVRATRSRRQPGSAFKPIVYAAALRTGVSAGDVVVDAPVLFPGADGRDWAPANHLDQYRGPITLRQALAVSSNAVAVVLADTVGLQAVIDLARDLGVRTPLRADLALALGASEVTPLDLAVAYLTVARGGSRAEPLLVTRITDGAGRTLAVPGRTTIVDGRTVRLPGGEPESALEPAVARELTGMLERVVDWGTAYEARRDEQERAGKTGTTNDYTDAWMVGFTPRHTIAVWIGDDDGDPLGPGESGARVALPAFATIADGIGTTGTPDRPERLPDSVGNELEL